jgi:hypothetical protein
MYYLTVSLSEISVVGLQKCGFEKSLVWLGQVGEGMASYCVVEVPSARRRGCTSRKGDNIGTHGWR